MIRIAFVCHGNICRSPMAEFVFKDMIKKIDVEENYFVVSRATSDEEIWGGVGNPMHRGTLGILNKYNISYDKSKRAVQLTRSDYEKYDLFIGMDNANIKNMHRIFGADPQSKIKLLLNFCVEDSAAAAHTQEVADPWYTGDFEKTYSDILKGCKGILSTLGGVK